MPQEKTKLTVLVVESESGHTVKLGFDAVPSLGDDMTLLKEFTMTGKLEATTSLLGSIQKDVKRFAKKNKIKIRNIKLLDSTK
ncbi:hypothetical protein ACFL1U_03465 [Patescibacteria group bacterium]